MYQPYFDSHFVFVTEYVFVGLDGANFSSPNYPQAYPNDVRYVWIFYTDRKFRLRVTFDYIDTESRFDSLVVEEEPYSGLLEWSGAENDTTPIIHSKDNHITVRFTTDASIGSSGFFGRVVISSFSQMGKLLFI